MSIGSLIRKTRIAKGLSQERLAKEIGVTRTTVRNWETGKHWPTKNQVPKLSRALGLDVSAFEQFSGGGVASDAPGETMMLPILEWSDLRHYVAGKLQMAAIRKLKEVKVDAIHPADSIALRVRDDSMSPEFRIGEMFIIDPNITPLEDDFVVVRLQSGEGLLRKYVPRRNEAFDLVPENSEYSTTTINTQTSGEILGVVVEHHKRRWR